MMETSEESCEKGLKDTSEIQSSKAIQSIDRNTIHRICSGQVVLNLATAVKELVENSLDAGATVIEIRLKEYGSELIEVIDNGSGVEEKHFQALTLKYHTSKLREFTDLFSVETFGFRGEALSSLCALAELSVITRHTTAPCGTKLEYNKEGHIINQKSCARQVGTTVSLQNIFYTLPVRHKEFHRNLRREFGKMVQILNAYCLISTSVKILCSNQLKKGARTTVVSTQGSLSIKDNIACVFGAKQVQTLMEVIQKDASAEVLQELGICPTLIADQNSFKVEGFLSSCAHGQGRSANDRQFFYINSRPCEPHKVMKMVNEVYHYFNRHQYPFVFLNIKMDQGNVDVNLTPDKRQVLLDHEKLVVATVKASLVSLYETIPSTFMLQNVSPKPATTQVAQSNLSAMLKQWSHSTSASTSPTLETRKRSLEVTENESNRGPKQPCVKNFFSYKIKSENNEICKPETYNEMTELTEVATGTEDVSSQIRNTCRELDHVSVLEDHVSIMEEDNNEILSGVASIELNFTSVTEEISLPEIPIEGFIKKCISSEELNKDAEVSYDAEIVSVECDNEICYNSNRTSINTVLSISSLRQEREHRKEKARHRIKNSDELLMKFMAKIDPSKNSNAENELRREISKDMFAKMEIIGQFNLGFIIVRLDSDLFIIDQHATDEIYNFETLQKTTVLQNQKLVIPQQLELTYVNETILIENREVFQRNGFEFIIDESAEPTKRIKLTAIPISKNWTFGKEDIDELLFMLQDAPHTMCRPSRVRAMFASRACRKSVMIGTALSKTEMQRLVDHMGEIDQPWNCPHGRPTMRHLVNMDFVYNRWAERLQE